MSKVFILIDSRMGYVGIHRNIVSARHHLVERQKYFRNNKLEIKEAEITFKQKLSDEKPH